MYVHVHMYAFKVSAVVFFMFLMENQDNVPELKYTCHTARKLMMQRIFLTEKKECEASTGQPEQLTSSQCKYYYEHYYDHFKSKSDIIRFHAVYL